MEKYGYKVSDERMLAILENLGEDYEIVPVEGEFHRPEYEHWTGTRWISCGADAETRVPMVWDDNVHRRLKSGLEKVKVMEET